RPVPQLYKTLAMAAAVPPRPKTEPTADFGNRSLGSVCRLFTHTWNPNNTTPINVSAAYGLSTRIAKMPAGGSRAPQAMTTFLARSTLHPRLISAPDAQPPLIAPTPAHRNGSQADEPTCCRLNPRASWK